MLWVAEDSAVTDCFTVLPSFNPQTRMGKYGQNPNGKNIIQQ